MQYIPSIGLEIHIQLNTKEKIFSRSKNKYGGIPNTLANIIDINFPGTLPVLNINVIKKAIKFGIAINGNINKISSFDRKNYFYPDLPKGYQISQFYNPIIKNGYINIYTDKKKKIEIDRAHLEEDAGKLIHPNSKENFTKIDLNRAGIPLLEIVTKPTISSEKEAIEFLKTLHSLICYLGICDGNMQEGSFRCDANISIRKKNEIKLGTRTEIKNLNSFKFIEKSIKCEIERQKKILNENKIIESVTLRYNEKKNEITELRKKETNIDYRYFPDPDLLPIKISKKFIEKIKKTLPELPEEKYIRFKNQYNLKKNEIKQILHSKEIANFFEELVKITNEELVSFNWVSTELIKEMKFNKNNIPISPEQLGKLILRIKDKTISNTIAKKIFKIIIQEKQEVDDIIKKNDLKQIIDKQIIEKTINDILEKNKEKFIEYKNGKTKLFGFFIGEIMKISKGKFNPEIMNEILKKKLKNNK